MVVHDFVILNNKCRANSRSDQFKKQRGDGEPSALTVNQKQRVNTCHIFLMESGTNTVKQTRRDASVVISRLLSLFSCHINSSTHFFVGADLEPTKL